MSEFREFTLWLTAGTGFLYALIKLIQWAIAFIGTRSVGEVTTFEAVLKAQEKLLVDCRDTCRQLRVAEQENEERFAKALAVKDGQILHERSQRDAERKDLYRQLGDSHRRIFECEGILRRHSWHDARKEKRSKDEEREA